MQGKMWLYARNKIFPEQNIAAQGMYWRIWKQIFKGHADTCLLIMCSSLGCVVFPPMVSSNFLGRRPKHEKINKSCTPGWYPWGVADSWTSGLFFFSIGFWTCRAEVAKTSRKPFHKYTYKFLQCCLHIALLLWHPTHYAIPKNTSQWRSMIGWDIGLVFCFLVWMPKQKSKVQTTLKKLIAFNDCQWRINIYI